MIQASLSHSVIARESSESDLAARPARWGMYVSMVWMEEMIRSTEAENSCLMACAGSFEGGGSSNATIASSSGIGSSRSSSGFVSRVTGMVSSGS